MVNDISEQGERVALVTGATGVAGEAFLRELTSCTGWPVVIAVSRSRQPPQRGVTWVEVDLEDQDALTVTLAPYRITHIFHAAQMPPPPAIAGSPRTVRLGIKCGSMAIRLFRRLPKLKKLLYRQLAIKTGMFDPTQRNLAMLRNAVNAATAQSAPQQHNLQHVVVVTGGRHYGMHMGPKLYPGYESHYVEDRTPRCPGPNWYHDLEDYVSASGDTKGWTWTILRPSFLLGSIRNGRHNLGAALGSYVALTAETGLPLDFLGDESSASVRTDLTSARQLARAACWSVDEPNAAGQAFNVATGHPFAWRDLWPDFAQRLSRQGTVTKRGVRFARLAEHKKHLWSALAKTHDLVEHDLDVLASPAYADQMMLLNWDATFDVCKLKAAGFDYFPTPLHILQELVATMEQQRLISKQRACTEQLRQLDLTTLAEVANPRARAT